MRNEKMELIRKILIGLLVIIILILVEFLRPLRAEERKPMFYLGAYAGLSVNNHYSSFRELSEKYYTCCPKYKSAEGVGAAFGALFEMPIAKNLFVGARFGFAQYDADFNPKDFIGNTEVRQPTPPYETILIQRAEVQYNLESKLSNIGFEPYIGFNAFRNLHAIAGFRLSYLYDPQFTQYEKLLSPNNVTFTNGSRIRNRFDNQEIPNVNALQIHGLLGLGYDLKIGANSYLTPEVKFFIPFTNVSNVEWKASALQFSLALKLPIYPAEKVMMKDTVYFRDTTVIAEKGISREFLRLKESKSKSKIVDTELGKVDRTEINEKYERVVPLVENLALDFKVFGVERDGTIQENPKVVIEEIETEEGFPLLPYVFFKKGNSNLNETVMKQQSPNEVEKFQENQLPWKTMDIYYELLNIIGRRLTDNPRSSIVLTGTNNNSEGEKGNLPLSLARANAVKDYLVKVWKINPARIRAEATNLPQKPTNPTVLEGLQENSRVEISSTDRKILAPVYLNEILRTSNPPVVEIHPVIQTSAGIKDYSMKITQGNSVLREYNHKDIPQKYSWNIEEEPVPMLEVPANINITAIDKIDQRVEIDKDITIDQKTIKTKRTTIEGDYRVERYSLILFDFDKAVILDNHKSVLDYIKTKITPNSIVKISGFADRTGSKDYNRDLARRRSDEVKKYFNLANDKVTIIPVGSDELIFDNDSPEGRSYSRTVKIEIRTPVGGK